ncbi:hypothetical protein M885DRAFT_63584 [Pelagophyceae sp. CCMP2097]|nr:hypothetical protein M885DRAFT_63584 [Pelagophyceae sp. CCMP2097]
MVSSRAGWTHGYDMYTLESSVVFHEYAVNSGRRRHVHMFWENGGKSKTSGKASGSSTASLKRLTAIIGMAPEVAAANDYDQTEDKRYGLGNVRDVAQFYKTFLVDVEHRTSAPLCKFVKTGVMHVEFSKFLRADRRGVDYMQLEHYDTAAAILTELDTNWRPKARQGLYKALEMGSVGWLANALDEAKRAELATTDPDLVLQVQNALAQAKRAKRS